MYFNNKIGFVALTTGLTSSFSSASAQNVNNNDKPNIILFFVDDLGWNDTSVPFWKEKTPSNKLYRTPNLEKMAAEGMKFTQAYACPVSTPSRVSLLTGMNAATHRVTNWTRTKDEKTDGADKVVAVPDWNVNGITPNNSVDKAVYATTLPMVLKKAGYTTVHVGKAHLGADGTSGANPLNLGYDVNVSGSAIGHPASYQGLQNFGNDDNGNPKSYNAVPGLNRYFGKDLNLTDVLTLEAIHVMDSISKWKQPFFLNLGHYTVHVPIQYDNRFMKNYDSLPIPKIEARYASMIEGMDRSMGDIRAFLKDRKLDHNTVIIFMSDNGGLSATGRAGVAHSHNFPLSSGKGSILEGGIREPMIVYWPGVTKPNTVCDNYLMIEDFFPTIAEIAGVKSLKTVQKVEGKSFVPFLKNKFLNKQTRSLFWHYPNIWGPKGPGIGQFSAIRKGDWKLIYYHIDMHYELYNILEDIGEKYNRFNDQPKLAKKLANDLGKHLKKVNAQMPTIRSIGKIVPYPKL